MLVCVWISTRNHRVSRTLRKPSVYSNSIRQLLARWLTSAVKPPCIYGGVYGDVCKTHLGPTLDYCRGALWFQVTSQDIKPHRGAERFFVLPFSSRGIFAPERGEEVPLEGLSLLKQLGQQSKRSF